MKRIFLTVFVFYLSNFLVSDEKKIEDCTLIANDEERLFCFDSFFKTDKKLILVDQDDIAIFQEKIEDTNGDDDKVIVKAPRSVINDNLVLVGVRLSGRDYLFELNDLIFTLPMSTCFVLLYLLSIQREQMSLQCMCRCSIVSPFE